MKKIELIQSIKQQDLILANAVSKMVDYIQDKWAAPYPSKEQTEAVNDYLRSVHANGDGTMNETRHSTPEDCHTEDNHQCHPCA